MNISPINSAVTSPKSNVNFNGIVDEWLKV